MQYDDLELKQPQQCDDYKECSKFVTSAIETIIQATIDAGRNQIIINTNLKLGLPIGNINKIAGPIVETWAYEISHDVMGDKNNEYHLINNVGDQQRFRMIDVILQFKKKRNVESGITAEVDVKATSEDFEPSGKSQHHLLSANQNGLCRRPRLHFHHSLPETPDVFHQERGH